MLRRGLLYRLPLGNGTAGIAVLMYHEVLEDGQDIDAWTVVRESNFRKQMEYLKTHYDVVSLDAACDVMRNGGQFKSKCAVVTFDDGYSGNCSVVLPIMSKLNLPFTVFCSTQSIERGELYWWDRVIHSTLSCGKRVILTDMLLGKYDFGKRLRGESRWNEIQRLLTDLKNVGQQRREQIVRAITRQTDESQQAGPLRPMTPKQVLELSDTRLATIGAHSETHDILTLLTPEEAGDSILGSKEKLEAWTGKRVDYFSYPNGDYSPELMRAVEGAGFLGAVTTEERIWNPMDALYAIPRIGIGRYDTLALFKAKISNAQ